MNIIARVAAFFGIKKNTQEPEVSYLKCNIFDNIKRLEQLGSLERIILACDVLDEHRPSQMFWFDKNKYNYEIDTVINVMKALEDVGMLEEISIEYLLSSHYLGENQIARVLIEIDYWDRMDSIDNPDAIIKILKIGFNNETYQTKTIARLKLAIDEIGKIEQLEEYIKDYKELIDIYAYGAKKLFDMYKKHMRDVKDDFSTEFIVDRIEANIDVDVLPSFKLDILQLKEKVESQNFLSRIDSIERLDDFSILKSSASSPLVCEICQKIIDGDIECRLSNSKDGDDGLIKLYYLTTKLVSKKKILFLIKYEYGFVYQEAVALSKENLINISLAKEDINHIYQDLDSSSLNDLAGRSKLLVIDSILKSRDLSSDLLDFCELAFRCCYYNYKTTETVCKDLAITSEVSQLALDCESKAHLTRSLYIVGGHKSIIERFFQLDPSVEEISIFGNDIVLLNDVEAEAYFEEKLEGYIVSSHIDILELRALHDICKLPLRRQSLPISVIRKIFTYNHNPQLE